MISEKELLGKKEFLIAQLKKCEHEVKKYLTLIERFRGGVELVNTLLEEAKQNGNDEQESVQGFDEEKNKVIKITEIPKEENEREVLEKPELKVGGTD
jgi:hypothetical protein